MTRVIAQQGNPGAYTVVDEATLIAMAEPMWACGIEWGLDDSFDFEHECQFRAALLRHILARVRLFRSRRFNDACLTGPEKSTKLLADGPPDGKETRNHRTTKV